MLCWTEQVWQNDKLEITPLYLVIVDQGRATFFGLRAEIG